MKYPRGYHFLPIVVVFPLSLDWEWSSKDLPHHHLVAESAGHAIQSLVINYHLPIINGIVVTDDLATAQERITGSLDRGREFAHAALEMASFRQKWI